MINETWIQFFIELKHRLIKCLLAFTLVFLVSLPFSGNIYHLLSSPLEHALQRDNPIIATDLFSTFLTPYKLTLLCAFLMAFPYGLLQLWQFIAPALYQHEKKKFFTLFLTSIVLAYSGIAFANLIVLPIMMHFFIHVAPSGVTVMPDIRLYANLIINLSLAFALAFQLPVIMLGLILMNWLDIESCQQQRPYVIVFFFVIGMLLTPPDIISQTLLALPLCALFEVSLLVARYLSKSTIK